MGTASNDASAALFSRIEAALQASQARTADNLAWLRQHLHRYFFLVNRDEIEAVAQLAAGLPNLEQNRRLTLADRDDRLIIAQLAAPGSLYSTLRELPPRPIAFAQITTSYAPLPGAGRPLEVLRFDFGAPDDQAIAAASPPVLPQALRAAVAAALERDYPGFDLRQLGPLLRLLLLNHPEYLRNSPPSASPVCSSSTGRRWRTTGSSSTWSRRREGTAGPNRGCCSVSATRRATASCSRPWRSSAVSASASTAPTP